MSQKMSTRSTSARARLGSPILGESSNSIPDFEEEPTTTNFNGQMGPLPNGVIPAILGFDLGSSGIRMILRYQIDGKWERLVVENDQARFRDDPRRDKGSFTSDCSETGKPALVHPDVPLGTGNSIKYNLYLVAGCAEDLLAGEFPPIADGKARLQTVPGYAGQLEKGLMELFQNLAAIVERACRNGTSRRLRIVKICLSTPSQFGHDLADAYETLIAKAFHLSAENIIHCNEAQALAHFLLDHLPNLEAETKVKKPDVGIFIDCGGHTSSIAAYQIRYSDSGESSILEIDSSTGTGGGSEEWLWGHISEECKPKVMEKLQNVNGKRRQAGSPELSEAEISQHWQRIRRRIVHEFLAEKKRAETEHEQFKWTRIPYFLPGEDGEDDEAAVVSLSSDAIESCWNRATKKTAELLQKRIGELSSAGDKIVTIVHGGTSRAPAMRNLISRICDQHDLAAPFYVEDLESLKRYDSITVASGAAMIGSNNLTVEDALSRGAVFGLQIWQSFKENADRDERAYRLFDLENGSREPVIPIEAGDTAVIICDPIFNQGRGIRSNVKWISPEKCYDFFDLSALLDSNVIERNTYRFRFDVAGRGNDMKFQLSIEYNDPESRVWTSAVQLPPMAMYWDRGHNCVLPGKEKMSLEEYLDQLLLECGQEEPADEMDVAYDADVDEEMTDV